MSNKNSTPQKTRLIGDNTPFAIKESYNQLRTNLMYTAKGDNGCPVYAVTSAEASAGKSTIISNLAISFAQLGKRVLLVDADMRRPVQYKNFGYPKKQYGLSELLSSIIEDDKDVICSPGEGLFLITGGFVPTNPSELIHSKRFESLIAKWRGEYDIVFIDLPPVGVVSDPLSISKFIDGYIIVTMANKSNAKRVNAAVEILKQVDAKILGMVINGTSLKGEGYGKYNYKNGYYNTEKS